MRAAIFNPYLDTLGGGERYTMSFAKALLDVGYSVDIQWRDIEIKNALESRFGMNLTEINFIPDIKRGDAYDLCFWVSDGSIPVLRSRRNFLHFQVPFHDVGGRSLINKMKLFRINKIICNSEFTKEFIDKEYGVESIIVYPPVSVNLFRPKRKENIIVSVGRFSILKQSKHQDILVKCFKKMIDSGLINWKLVLAGGVEVGTGDYLDKIRKMSDGYPIEILESPDFNVLKDIYGRARIFWSASGFGENEEKCPEKVEHFGISVVEAMTSGAIPIVVNAGGFKEIVTDGENGFLWNSEQNLIRRTLSIIENKADVSSMKRNAVDASSKFSEEVFSRQVVDLINQ